MRIKLWSGQRWAFGGMCMVGVMCGASVLAPYLKVQTERPSAETQREANQTESANVQNSTGQAGMIVSIDPNTGNLRPPTSNERLAVTAAMALNRSTVGLQQIVHADGSVSVDLQGRFQSFALARVGDDGSVKTGCATTEKEAEEFLGIEVAEQEQGNDVN